MTEIKKTFVILFLLFLFYPLNADSREPAANVLIISQVFGEEGFPSICNGIIFHGKTVFITDYLKDVFKRKDTGNHRNIVIAPELKNLEDTSRILIVLTEMRCYLFMSELALPPPAIISSKAPIPLHIKRWFANSNGGVTILKESNTINLSPGEKKCIVIEKGDKCSHEIYNYGILPIYYEPMMVKPVKVKIDGNFSGSFFGPGDRQHFDVVIPSAGTLVVEYKAESGTGMLDSRVLDERRKTLGTGSATFSKPQTARVELSYRGGFPSGYDIGFMFIPDIPLSCSIEIEPGNRPGETLLRLVVQNITDKAVIAPLPMAGTVRWYVDGRLISAAVPGMPPGYHRYLSGEKQSYEIVLPTDIIKKKIKAELDADKYRVQCEVNFRQ